MAGWVFTAYCMPAAKTMTRSTTTDTQPIAVMQAEIPGMAMLYYFTSKQLNRVRCLRLKLSSLTIR